MRHDSSIELLLFAISAVHLVKAETCLNQAQLAGIVFGVSLGTLVLAISIAFILWWVTRGRRTGDLEKEYNKDNIPQQDTEYSIYSDWLSKMTSCHSLKQKHRLKNIQRLQSQRSRSSESLDKLKELKRMAIENRDIAPLGFDIQQSDGRIFIDNIKENGPADKSGNMFVGDRIKTLCVSFEGMLLEDAINILSYAAPYKMKLELERTLENEGQKHAEDKAPVDQSLDIETTPHHAFRSISLNSLSSDGSGFVMLKYFVSYCL
ncbi:Periaxin [Toxocara canis]|uniref:Periaxin n=1 Tax=Toxocara canis TaxID=6265 RepID=A0A0B2W357_TOXCA|nr:Periaxin [Toxocara canis]